MNALRSSLATATLAAVALSCAPVSAGMIWDGGGANDNWTTGANWNGLKLQQTPPPNNGTANIHMAGTTRRTPMVNVPYSINSLTFDPGAAAFVILDAQPLTIGAGGVRNYDDDIQTVIGPIRLAADQTWSAISGRLQMDEVNLNGFDLAFGGAFRTDMIGVIHGAGDVTLPDAYASTVTMLGPNTYSGTTTVAGGTLVLKKTSLGGAAIPGRLNIGGGAATPLATVRLDANEQISQAAGNEVTVLSGGLLDVNSRTETLAKLMVSGGGDVTIGALGKLTVGEAVVTGPGSTWTNAYGSKFYVGDVGAAALDILNRGLVTSDDLAYLGYAGGSTGKVTVRGDGNDSTHDIDSIWNTRALTVGRYGSGVLNILGGGIVNTGAATSLGTYAGSTGAVNVDGVGSAWQMAYNSSLVVGDQGAANINVTKGGFMYSGDADLGVKPGSNGVVRVDGPGSYWYSAGDIEIANGELAVTNQGRVTSSLPLLIDSPGTLSGNGVVESNIVYNGGRVAPGPAANALTINGYYIQQPYGTLAIELGGSNKFDQLLVPGAGTIASLDGTLEVKLTGGFTPLVGQTFTIVSAYDVDGAFANLVLPAVPGRKFDVIYNPQSVVLRVGLAVGGGAAVRGVPEPSALALLALGACGLALVRPRRREDD